MTKSTFEPPTIEALEAVVAHHEITSRKSLNYSEAVAELIGDESGPGYRQQIMRALYVHVRDEVEGKPEEEASGERMLAINFTE